MLRLESQNSQTDVQRDAQQLVQDVASGDRRALAKLLTQLERLCLVDGARV